MSREDFLHEANLLFDQQKNKEHLELCNKELTLNDKTLRHYFTKVPHYLDWKNQKMP